MENIMNLFLFKNIEIMEIGIVDLVLYMETVQNQKNKLNLV
jgi:hypothetical protein